MLRVVRVVILASLPQFAALSQACCGQAVVSASADASERDAGIAACEAVFSEHFADAASSGFRVIAPAGIHAESTGVEIGQGPSGGNASVLIADLPPGETLTAGMDMPETDPRGLDYTFCLRVETDPPWPDGARFLEMRINHGGAADSIYAAEPLEHPEPCDGSWLERATKEVFQAHAQHVYRGWTRYRGNTANAFLRRYDGRKASEPLSRLIQLTLRNLTTDELRVRVSLAEVTVTRIDIDALPVMRSLLTAPHPFIRQTREQIIAARTRANNGAAMPEAVLEDLRRAREFLTCDFAVPRQQAAWPSPVECDTEGCEGKLVFAPPSAYECPKCGRRHAGERFAGLIAYEQHRLNGDAVRCLGFAWQGTDDERFARKAEGILLDYATAIADFQLGHNWLGDCWLMEGFLEGYDYIREWASPATRSIVEQRLLMPMLRRIHHYNHHYPEGYAALLRICTWCAVLSGDADWLYYLVVSPTGNRDVVLRHGLTDDHVSLKGAAYHGSLMRSISTLGQSLENCGVPFFDDALRPVYLVIPKMLFPDGTLPAFGHANIGLLPRDLGVEIAYRYYRDPVLLTLTSEEFREDPSARIFWDDPVVPPAPPLRQRSGSLNSLGLTMLRSRDTASVLALSWGAPQRNDPSRLDFQFYGAGGHLIWSSGITGYGNSLFERWYEQSVSRNGLVVDEQTQETVAGTLVAVDLESSDQFVAAELVNAFPDTRWMRICVLLDDGAAVIIDRFSATSPRMVDWVCQLPGTVRASLRLTPEQAPFRGIHGYDVLADTVEGDGSRPFHFLLQPNAGSYRSGRGIRITPAPQPRGRFFIAQGVTGHEASRSPVGILRVEQVQDTVFATLMEPLTRDGPSRSQVEVLASDPAGGRIALRRGGRDREIRFHVSPEPGNATASHLRVFVSPN